MSERTIFAKLFAERNDARVKNARIFRDVQRKEVALFLDIDRRLKTKIEEMTGRGEELDLDLPIAEPILEVEDFLTQIEDFIDELETVDAAEVMTEAEEFDAQDDE